MLLAIAFYFLSHLKPPSLHAANLTCRMRMYMPLVIYQVLPYRSMLWRGYRAPAY